MISMECPTAEDTPPPPPHPLSDPFLSSPSIPNSKSNGTMIKVEEGQQQSQQEGQGNGHMDGSAEAIVKALFAVAGARSAAVELGAHLREMQMLGRRYSEEAKMERECQQTVERLEDEERMHQEELKLINRDMDQLEVFLRFRKTEYERKKREMERRMDSLRAKVAEAPADGMMRKEEEVVDGHHHAAATASPSSPNQLSLFLWAFQWFLMFQQQQQQMQGPLTAPKRQMPTVQQAKMKKCLICFKDIHRNAPTCPFCKNKITSKASKRVRK